MIAKPWMVLEWRCVREIGHVTPWEDNCREWFLLSTLPNVFPSPSLTTQPPPFCLLTLLQTAPRKSDPISDLEPFPRPNKVFVVSSKSKDGIRTSPYYTSWGESTSRTFYSITTRCAWTRSDYWAGSGGISGTGSVSSCTNFNTSTRCFFLTEPILL